MQNFAKTCKNFACFSKKHPCFLQNFLQNFKKFSTGVISPLIVNSNCSFCVDFTCDGKSETLLHAISPCSERYHGCHRGIANEMRCPNGTVFFPLRQRCIPRSQSEWCATSQSHLFAPSNIIPMKLVGTFETFSVEQCAHESLIALRLFLFAALAHCVF